MRIDHKLEPLMQVKERLDHIPLYGCYQVTFNFMLKPQGIINMEEVTQLITKMMKASCDVIEEENRCLTDLNIPPTGDTTLSP